MSDYDRVKESIDLREYAAQYLQKSVGGLYCCPVCNSGKSGKRNSDGALGIFANGKKWKCQSCGVHGDIYDMVGIVNDTTNKAEQLEIAADYAGIRIERKGETMKTDSKTNTAAGQPQETKKGNDTTQNDYTAGRERHRRYIAECSRRLREKPLEEVVSYLSERGITYDEAVMLGIGYDEHHKIPWFNEDGTKHFGLRVVIPWAGNDYYHADRCLDKNVDSAKYAKPKNDEVGEQPFYNVSALDQDYVIVTEGEIDALAVGLCGYNAVSIGGTANISKFATECAARNYGGVVIDMLDCDGERNEKGELTKGRAAGMNLVSVLAEAGITTLSRAEYGIGETDTYGGHKDAGEWFAANRGELTQALEFIKLRAHDKKQEAKDAEYREAMKHLNVKDPAKVARDVFELREVYEPVPTGISSLDEALGGGVNLGELTIFGAVSSYGKTTLAVQIADHMAAAGYPCLFVTIEQSAKEIVAKSLSRLIYTENLTGWNIATPSEITSLRTRRIWKDGQNATLRKAVEDYERMIAPNMRILEGNRQPEVSDIRAIATVMKEHDGKAPLIFVDYLQLLAARNERDSDKQAADYNVSEMRKMARDLNTHIWCISSLNRESYSNGVTMTAFKESGSLEFGSDNLMGLQMRGMEEIISGISGTDAKVKREVAQRYQKNKSKTERDCELVILKQRNGALPNEPLPLVFKPMAAYFMEPTNSRAENQTRTRARL